MEDDDRNPNMKWDGEEEMIKEPQVSDLLGIITILGLFGMLALGIDAFVQYAILIVLGYYFGSRAAGK